MTAEPHPCADLFGARPSIDASPFTTPQDPARSIRTTRRRLMVAVPIFAAALWLVSLLWSARAYVPIWDGRVYADCAVHAATGPVSLSALRCAGHPTHAYIGVLALVQRLSPGSMPLMLATNAALLGLGAIVFARLLRALFPAPGLSLERSLLVAALLIDPIVVAGVVQVNVDFAVMVFLLCATAALVKGRRGWAIVFGVLTAFSKETGALLYGGLLVAWWLAAVLPRPVPRDVRNALIAGVLAFAACMALLPWAGWTVPTALAVTIVAARAAFQRPFAWPLLLGAVRRALTLAPLALPLVGYAAYLVWRALFVPRTAVLWGEATGGLVIRFLLFPQLSRGVRDYLALIFVVNFRWIIGGAVAAAAIAGGIRQLQWRRPAPMEGADGRLVRFAVLLAAVAIYLVTRIPTAVNARYMLPVYPVVFAIFLASLLRLQVSRTARRGLLVAVPVLFTLSAWHTADPVSRVLWGTFSAGRRDVLHIRSMLWPQTGGTGRDESVYNLEWVTGMSSVLQAGLDRLHPAAGRTFIVSDEENVLIVGPVDARSQRRLWGARLVEPLVLQSRDLAAGTVQVDSAWYLEFPYAENEIALRSLRGRYTIGRPDTVWVDGFALGLRPIMARTRGEQSGAAAGRD